MFFFVLYFICLTHKSSNIISSSYGHFSFSLQHRQTKKVTRTKITYSNLMFPRSLATYRHSVEHLGEATKSLFFPVLETGRKEFFRGNKDNKTIEHSWDLDQSK